MPAYPTIICSQGNLSARGSATAEVPRFDADPSTPKERVLVADPRRIPTRTGPPAFSRPRNPEVRTWPPAKARGVELPDGLPNCRGQRIVIDPELLAQWEREAATAKAAGAAGAEEAARRRRT